MLVLFTLRRYSFYRISSPQSVLRLRTFIFSLLSFSHAHVK